MTPRLTPSLPMDAEPMTSNGYSAEHEAKVAASYHSIHTPEGHAFFHDCCGSLRLRIDDPAQSDMRALLYFTADQARELRDKLNEWFPPAPESSPTAEESPDYVQWHIRNSRRVIANRGAPNAEPEQYAYLHDTVIWLADTLALSHAHVAATVAEAVRKERKTWERKRDLEREKCELRNGGLLFHGGNLATAAYNLCQREHLTDDERRSLKESYEAWDKALRALAESPV